VFGLCAGGAGGSVSELMRGSDWVRCTGILKKTQGVQVLHTAPVFKEEWESGLWPKEA